MIKNLELRPITLEDAPLINKEFVNQGWNKPIELYNRYYDLQASGAVDFIQAVVSGQFAGYLTIHWESGYVPFKERKIPEIQDFNVLKVFQRKGIGTALMDEAERRIKKVSKFSGIGFGVTKDYGPAQILYVKRGYVPDGNGLTEDLKSLDYGDKVTVGDSLAFYLVKAL